MRKLCNKWESQLLMIKCKSMNRFQRSSIATVRRVCPAMLHQLISRQMS